MLSRFEVMEDDCIGCALCRERAPANMDVVAEKAVARVVAQPSDQDEERACIEAAEYCPVGALSVLAPSSIDEYPTAAAGSG